MNERGPRENNSRVAWTSLVSNSNWNFAAFAIVVMANFLTLPYVVHRLGMAQFGFGGLVLAILAPMMFVGAVLGQVCVRELAPMVAAHRLEAARQFLSSALVLCLFGCGVVLLVFVAGGPFLIARLTGPSAEAGTGLAFAVLVAGVGWVAQQLFQVLQSTIVSTQQFRVLAVVNAVSALASSLCLLAATWVSPTLLGFLWGTSLGLMLTLTVTTVQARRHAAALFPLVRPRLADVRLILAFCRWQVPAQLSGAFALQADRYLLGATSTTSVIGQFNIATRLQEVVYMGVLKIGDVLFPHFSAEAGRPHEQQANLLMTSSWLVNTIAAAALAPLIPLSAAVITLWVGSAGTEVGAPILRMLVTAGIIGSGINVFTYFAMATGHVRRLGVMSMVHAGAVVIFSTVLILGWGALAAGLGFVVANAIRLGWATVVTSGMVGGRMRPLDVVQLTLPPLAVGLLVGWGCHPVGAGSWLAVVFYYALIGSAVVLASLGIGIVLPSSRALIGKVFAGVRDHFSKR